MISPLLTHPQGCQGCQNIWKNPLNKIFRPSANNLAQNLSWRTKWNFGPVLIYYISTGTYSTIVLCAKNMTKINWNFLLMKSSKNILFFTCILPYYGAHDITKELLKNSHFENMTAGSLLRCQNSLEIPLKYHWNDAFSEVFF